jgi:hypothetical protein
MLATTFGFADYAILMLVVGGTIGMMLAGGLTAGRAPNPKSEAPPTPDPSGSKAQVNRYYRGKWGADVPEPEVRRDSAAGPHQGPSDP